MEHCMISEFMYIHMCVVAVIFAIYISKFKFDKLRANELT